MRKAIFVAVLVALVVVLCASPAVAAKSGTYWPGGSKPTATVDASRNVTVEWPAIIGPFDYYTCGYETAGWTVPSGSLSYTIPEALSSGRHVIRVDAHLWATPAVVLDEIKCSIRVP